MKITILADNIGSGELQGEWGLSFHIEFGGKRLLLDTGGSDLFLKNACLLGIDISAVDAAVLSHAHYDHSLGMDAFFGANTSASFYVSPAAEENCYSGRRFFGRYIGMPEGVLSRHSSRIIRPSGITQILPGAFIVPHSTPGLELVGRKARMYRRTWLLGWQADDFSHEQTLVLKDSDGLVILNSCSHAGVDVITEEVRKAFPDQPVKAYIGGFHLFRSSGDEVRRVAAGIRDAGISELYTGHCTGDEAFLLLQKELGSSISQFRCGMEIQL